MNMYSDEPIDSFTSDELGRGEFARNLALALSTGDAYVRTISLIGEWGCGKTSVINLVKKQLQETGINIIDFNPWKLADGTNKNDLIRPFLQEFVYSINAYLSRKCLDSKSASERQHWKKERKYFLRITASYSRGFMTMGEVRDGILANLASGGNIAAQITAPIARYVFSHAINNRAASIDEDEKAISRFLVDNDIHNLIIIDDIDRLTPDETLQLFRIVREIASFENTVHLLCFDKRAAAKSLRDANLSKTSEPYGEHYIEKIINVEYSLPNPRHCDVISIVRRDLADIANYYNAADTIVPSRDGSRFENTVYAISDLLLTMRDIKRYMNTLLLNKNVVCRDGVFALNFVDFVVLECIREKRTDCYYGIYNNKSMLTMNQDYRNKIEKDEWAKTEGELDKLHGGDSALLTLLQLLFPVAYSGKSYWNHGIEMSVCICEVASFDVYFKNIIAPGDNEHIILPELRDFISKQDSKQGMLDYLRELQAESTADKFSHFLDIFLKERHINVNGENIAHFASAMFDFGTMMLNPDANDDYSERCYTIAKKYLDAFTNDFFAGKNDVLTVFIKETDSVAPLTSYIANVVDIFVANHRGMKGCYKAIVNDTITSCLEKIKAQPSGTIAQNKKPRSLWDNVLKLITNIYNINDGDVFVLELERVADKEIAPLMKEIYDKTINKVDGFIHIIYKEMSENNYDNAFIDLVFDDYDVIKTFYDNLDAQLARGDIDDFDKDIVKVVFSRIMYVSSDLYATFSNMINKYGEKWDNLRAIYNRFYGGK